MRFNDPPQPQPQPCGDAVPDQAAVQPGLQLGGRAPALAAAPRAHVEAMEARLALLRRREGQRDLPACGER